MKIVRTCTKLVEYNEVDILGVLYRRYSSDDWRYLSDGEWVKDESVRLESDFNELVRSMARGTGKTIANIAKMISPLTQATMELSFEVSENGYLVHIKTLDRDCFIGRLVERPSGEWCYWQYNKELSLSFYHLDAISIKLKQLSKTSSDRGTPNGG